MALHLVTGGAGFIGSHLVRGLVVRGDRARVLDDLSGGSRENLSGLEVGASGSGAPVELVLGDVADPRAVREACEGVEGVFHEAALVSVPLSVERPADSFRINVRGTFEVLRAARDAGARTVVLASSSAVYGMDERVPKREDMLPAPASPYAGDKLTAETLLAVWGRSFGMRTRALRYFNVYGPRQADDSPYSGVIALFADAALAGRAVTLFGDGEQTRDFVYVEDVVAANLAALDAAEPEPGSVFNVGTGEAVSISGLHRAIGEEAGRWIEPAFGPARAGDVRHSRADVSLAREVLGFEPRTSLREGLRRTLAWFRERGA